MICFFVMSGVFYKRCGDVFLEYPYVTVRRAFWWEPVASTALKSILSLLLARVSMPDISIGLSGQKAPTVHKSLIGRLAQQSWTHVLTHQIWVLAVH